jgi:hypothetical protein
LDSLERGEFSFRFRSVLKAVGLLQIALKSLHAGRENPEQNPNGLSRKVGGLKPLRSTLRMSGNSCPIEAVLGGRVLAGGVFFDQLAFVQNLDVIFDPPQRLAKCVGDPHWSRSPFADSYQDFDPLIIRQDGSLPVSQQLI